MYLSWKYTHPVLGFGPAEIPVRSGQWLLPFMSPYRFTEADLRDLVESELKGTVRFAAGVLPSSCPYSPLSELLDFVWQ